MDASLDAHDGLSRLLHAVHNAGRDGTPRHLHRDVARAIELAGDINGALTAGRQRKIARQSAELKRLYAVERAARADYLRRKAEQRDVEGRRPTWDEYGLALARVAATRATCPRLAVGAVLLSADGRVLATGYNGALAGAPHCADVGCEIDAVTGGCSRAVHAERNALAHAPHGLGGEEATLYVTHAPCGACAREIVGAGVRRVVFADAYRQSGGAERLVAAGVVVEWHGVARLTRTEEA